MRAGVVDHENGEAKEWYPGLWVWDKRCYGAITIGESRLPLYMFFTGCDPDEWAYAYDDDAEALRSAQHAVRTILDQRGEFARLLLVLADVERRASRRTWTWWERPKYRAEVAKQLRRCLEALEAEEQIR